MSQVMHVRLESFVGGLFVIQPAYNAVEFEQLIERELPKDFITPYVEVYRDFSKCKSGTIVCDDQWIIVVFCSHPVLIRRHALREIVSLGRELMDNEDRRTLFISASTPQSTYRRR